MMVRLSVIGCHGGGGWKSRGGGGLRRCEIRNIFERQKESRI
jgi:hypothetical protein